MVKKIVIAVASLVLVLILCMRVVSVNNHVDLVPQEIYSMNETIELSGAFLQTKEENTDGYSIKVLDAKPMSFNDYMRAFGNDETCNEAGLDANSLIVLTVEITNSGNNSGRLFVVDWKLITENKNEYLIRDSALWSVSEPALGADSGPILDFSIKEDSSYITYIPFKTNLNDEEDKTQYKRELQGRSYYLELSHLPVKKMVRINL